MGWVHDELSDINIGDQRLNRRTLAITEQLENSTEGSFTQSFRTRSELAAAYRLFDNNFVFISLTFFSSAFKDSFK